MKRSYTTLAGTEVKFDEPTSEVAAFIERAQALLADKRATEDDMIVLVYGPENPILEKHPLFPDRGWVTREVFDNPVYAVFADLVARKHAQRERVDVSKLGDKYTITIAQACLRREVTDTTIRKAISAGKLSTFRKNGNYFLNADEVDALEFGLRGSLAPAPLKIVAGAHAKIFLYVKTAKKPELGVGEKEVSYDLEKWRRVGVLSSNAKGLRFFVLVPATEEHEPITIGHYHVKGKFRYAEKVNSSAAARKAWEEFRAI